MTQTTAQPLLFSTDEIPETATPVSEASQEWMDAQLLQAVESIRFNESRCAGYVAAVGRDAHSVDPRGFLDFVIEQLGGRSQ